MTTYIDKYQFDGDFNVVPGYYPYQHKLKLEDIEFDQTYGKSEDWMVKNIKPSKKVLFWDVGIKEYDLDYIEPINEKVKSEYEKIIDREIEENTNKSNNFS